MELFIAMAAFIMGACTQPSAACQPGPNPSAYQGTGYSTRYVGQTDKLQERGFRFAREPIPGA